MNHLRLKRALSFFLVVLFRSTSALSQQPTPTFPPTASAQPVPKVIHSAADIPPRSYPLDIPPSEVVRTGEGFQALADAVRKDDEQLLHADLRDNTVRLNLEYDLADLDLLDGNRLSMQARLARIESPEEKPAQKLTATMFAMAYANAWTNCSEEDPRFPATLQSEYTRLVNASPWDLTGPALKQSRASLLLQTPALMVGQVKSYADPEWQRTHTVDARTASWIIVSRTTLLKRLPYNDMRLAVLTAYLSAHKAGKPERWSAREIHFPPTTQLTPVVIAVWDTGVDRALYKNQLDGNLSDPVPTLDYPFTANSDLTPRTTEQMRLWPEEIKWLQGGSDLWSGVVTPEADAYAAKLRSIPPEQLSAFNDQVDFSSQFMHGTHVAGIALRGNPAARLYVLRETMWWGAVPKVPTLEEQRAIAARYPTVFADFKKHHVRVVNLSWTASVADFEGGLKANGRCTSAEDCRTQATELNYIQRDALKAAMSAAPEVLFVCIPGNANLNSTFNDVFPGSFDLPNVLTVGAVDAAGDETNFTSFGPTVRLYANGEQVESYIPGGQTLRASGTSMAAPQVTNAVGKLLAVDPSLGPEQVIHLLLAGSDLSRTDGRPHVLNPARSLKTLYAEQKLK